MGKTEIKNILRSDSLFAPRWDDITLVKRWLLCSLEAWIISKTNVPVSRHLVRYFIRRLLTAPPLHCVVIAHCSIPVSKVFFANTFIKFNNCNFLSLLNYLQHGFAIIPDSCTTVIRLIRLTSNPVIAIGLCTQDGFLKVITQCNILKLKLKKPQQ